jgi:hypothetical protein
MGIWKRNNLSVILKGQSIAEPIERIESLQCANVSVINQGESGKIVQCIRAGLKDKDRRRERS